MISKSDLAKAYRIIRNVTIVVLGFCAFFCMIDIPRLMGGRSGNPFSIIGFPAFVIALRGLYKLEKSEQHSKAMLLAGAIVGGFCIGADPDHPGDGIPLMFVLGIVSQLYIKAREWKYFA